MDLKFPELSGGPVQGLNDAGVENFQGAIDVYVSRECGQNSGDAPRPGISTVRVEFDRITMPANEIPGFGQLRLTLNACLQRWGDKVKEREFFEHAIQLAEQDQISILKISDYGTTGLTGDDADEKGRWFALVKSQGVSNKEDTAGGSFGIGKSSPFAASRFRTVFYGTRTEAQTFALQGVSRLVSHKNEEGRLTQGVGFIGQYDETGGEGGEPIFRAIRNQSNIPPQFRRTESGTDIWVVGYRSGDEWSNDLVRSILSNFWPAIHRGSIQFRVGEQNITQENLAALIGQHIGHEEFEAQYFYKAILSQPIKKRLKHVGECELYLTAADPDLPRKICMVRNTGMRIYDYQPKACRVPFSGLFICTNNDGNKLLRKLEPPKHDTWDPKRIEGQDGKKALDEIKLWIREEVKKLNPLFAGDSFNESELAKYVPDAADDSNSVPQEQTGDSEEESLDPRPRPEDPPIKPITAKPLRVTPGDKPPSGPGPGGERGGGGSGGGSSKTNPGSTGGTDDEPAPPKLRVRSFRSNPNQYELILRSEEDFTGAVRIFAVGEDGHSEPVDLKSAALFEAHGAPLVVSEDSIQNVHLKGGTPLRITATIDALGRRSLVASFMS